MLNDHEVRNLTIQGVLICFYVILAVLFAQEKKTWPMSLYYIGCFIKDSGVLILGLWFLRK
jgi:hypothetical protein